MPDTRPGLKFDSNGVCYACIHFEQQKNTDWEKRWKELEALCDKYRGKNGNDYDCAIAVSGGKDSHFQTYIIKEKLKMNPVLITTGNLDWTDTGRKNLENLSDEFGCDMIMAVPNRKVARKMLRKSFEDIGSPGWYLDASIYAFPVKIAQKLGVKLLIYGEDINYMYGGEHDSETSHATLQSKNDVVKPVWEKRIEDGILTEQELNSVKQPEPEEIQNSGLEMIYLSYFVPWNSHNNYEIAKRWGFKHLGHEYQREGSVDNYDQIDSIGYLFNPFLKYPKFGHSIATDIASRWIRYGLKTREEMIPYIEEYDGKLDQGTLEKFCEFTKMSVSEFYKILDKWYNPELFEQDNHGVWHPKFKVGIGLIDK